MISVITPAHKVSIDIWKQTVDSMSAQTYQGPYEWVICPNGKALKSSLPDYVEQARNVRIVPFKEETHGSIGLIKNFAFSQGKGDILVELDWDDILMPTALEEVAKAFDEGADFCSSNAFYFVGDFKKSQRFNSAYGWRWRPFTYNGHELDEILSFPVSAGSILSIHNAPDHLRAWKRATYEQLGGHDVSLPVADDHDLMIRTYLAGCRMVHLDRCLYGYRNDPGNTVNSSRNAEIQQFNHANYRKYLEPVALKFAKDSSLLALDLGAGFNHQPGYASVDAVAPADFVCDLNERWPFEDNSVGVIRAHDILEHLTDKQHAVSEIHRVLAHGGFILSFTPSALGQGGWQDPTHKSAWVKNSWLYYTKSQFMQYIRNNDIRFLTHCLCEEHPSPWHKEMGIPYVTFEGQAIKPGGARLPGLME